MALIEIELRIDVCTNLTWFILAKSPIPVPWLTLLGPARLLSKPFQWQSPVLGDAPPGFTVPPGTLSLRAPVTITHVSLNELVANAAAPGVVTDCMAWLLLMAEPGRLRIHLLRLEAQGRPPQVFATPLFIGQQLLPLDDVDDVRAAAIVRDGEVVTIRFAVGGNDNLLHPPGNLLLQDSDAGWLIRVSGDVFVDRVRRQLADALDPPPAGTTTAQGPDVVWLQRPAYQVLPTGPGSLEPGAWGVSGLVELEKEDACADVDLSVTVQVTLTISPNIPLDRVDLGLRVSSNAADWDVFRCWLITGGIASFTIGIATNIVAGIMVAVSTLVMIAEFVRLEAGNEVKGTGVGGGFTKVGSDDTAVWYSGTVGLPSFSTGTIRDATVGPHGLVVRGSVSIAALDHTITFEPAAGTLVGRWSGSYSCRNRRWRTSYEVASIVVRDLILVADPTPDQLQRRRLIEGLGVQVFPTSTFLRPGPAWLIPVTIAPGEWTYDAPSWATGSPIITPTRTAPPPVGDQVMFLLHTSAGIRRYDIGPVPPVPASEARPSAIVLGLHDANCRLQTRQWTRLQQLEWLVDPAPYDYGIRPMRQWMLTLHTLPPHANLIVHARGAREDVISRHPFNGAASGFIEVLTEPDVSLVVEHNLSESDAEVRVTQRWLLPTRSERLPGPAEGVSIARTRTGEPVVLVSLDERTLAVAHDGLVEWRGSGGGRQRRAATNPLSVSLPNGQVAAIAGDTLIVAVPWGRVDGGERMTEILQSD